MSEVVILSAERRTQAGKGAARATRRAGRVPAVIYGNKQPATLISLDPVALMLQMRRHGFYAHIYEIAVDGGTERALARDVQLHPLSGQPIHVDFMRFSADTHVTVEVEIRFINDLASPGIKRGGVLNVVAHEIELVCSPENIPDVLTVDLSGMEIGRSVHVGDLALPAGVRPVLPLEATVCSIASPTDGSVPEAPIEEEGEAVAEAAATA